MEWHVHHERARRALDGEASTVIAHVLAETYSVATRLPEPFRASSSTMVALLESLPHDVVGLSSERVLPALRRMSKFGVSGGQTYDGLIAATAVEHGLTLITMDRRATTTYDAVGVDLRFLE